MNFEKGKAGISKLLIMLGYNLSFITLIFQHLIFRKECLCCFQHIDFVTAICFHPRNDQFFLSGSLDGKLRLWNIPDKKVALWNEVTDGASKLITTANFIQVK